jgi:hypothetical protein
LLKASIQGCDCGRGSLALVQKEVYTLGTLSPRIMVTQFIGIKEFRQNLSRLAKESRRKKTSFIVMHHAVPVLRVTPVSEREAALERLAQDVALAREQWKRGEYYTTAEVEKMLGL